MSDTIGAKHDGWSKRITVKIPYMFTLLLQFLGLLVNKHRKCKSHSSVNKAVAVAK